MPTRTCPPPQPAPDESALAELVAAATDPAAIDALAWLLGEEGAARRPAEDALRRLLAAARNVRRVGEVDK